MRVSHATTRRRPTTRRSTAALVLRAARAATIAARAARRSGSRGGDRLASRLHDLQLAGRAESGNRAVVHPFGKRRRGLKHAGIRGSNTIEKGPDILGGLTVEHEPVFT